MLENHNDLSASFVRFARSLAGIKRPEPVKSSSSIFGLFGGSRKGNQEESK